MAKKEPIFPDGFIFKPPRRDAPEWIKASISIKVAPFIEFLQKHQKNGWVNIDIKKSARTGGLYSQLDMFERADEKAEQEALAEHDQKIAEETRPKEPPVNDVPDRNTSEDINPEDIPF